MRPEGALFFQGEPGPWPINGLFVAYFMRVLVLLLLNELQAFAGKGIYPDSHAGRRNFMTNIGD